MPASPPPPERPLYMQVLLDRQYGLVRKALALLLLPVLGILTVALFLALMLFVHALF